MLADNIIDTLYRYEGCNLRPELLAHRTLATPSRALILTHIPKTAGTTVLEFLKRQFDETSRLHYRIWTYGTYERNLRSFAALPPELRACWELVSGHGPWGVHEVLPQPADYIVVLRDPVAREISHYRYARDFSDHKDYGRIQNSRMTLLDYLRYRYEEKGRFNVQASYVMGSTGGTTCSPAEVIAAAKERYTLLGVTEDLDVFIRQLCQLASVEYRPYENEKVSRSKREEVPAAVLDYIRAQNEVDMALWQWARGIKVYRRPS